MQSDDIKDLYPLTPFQEGMLFDELATQDEGEARIQPNFQQWVFDLEGPLDVAAFARAIDRLFERHDALRTLFRSRGQRPLQVVLKRWPQALTLRDMTGAAPEAVAAEIAADRHRPIQLTRQPALRLTLLRRSPSLNTMLWSFHHIALDGWCIGLLQEEIAALYLAEATGEATGGRLAALPRPGQLRDLVRWIESRDRAAGLAYWKAYLDGYPAVTLLPGQTRPRAGAPRPAKHRLVLPAATAEGLRRLAAGASSTMNTVMQTAWGVLLGRLQDRPDVVIGAVAALRPPELPAIERLIGPCVTTMPLRVRFDLAETFAALLRRQTGQAPDWLAHAYFPLAEVQAAWAGHGHLFEHYLAFENFPLDARFRGDSQELAPGIALTNLRIASAHGFGIGLIVQADEELSLEFSYDERALAAADVAALARRLAVLLEALAESDTAAAVAIGDLPLLTAEDREQVTERFPAGAEPVALAADIPALRARLLAEAGAAGAVTWRGRTLSHDELERRAAALAARLAAEHGVGRGDRVALLLPSGLDLVTAMLACLRLGCAFVPVDPAAPAARTRVVFEDGARLVLAEREPEDLPAGIRLLLTGPELWAEPAPVINLPAPGGDAPAYIIYTSGTTGRPKGVQVPQRALLNYVGWLSRAFAVGPGDVAPLLSSPAYDLGYTALFGMLLLGGRLVLPDEDERMDPDRVVDLILREGITLMKVAPSFLGALLQAPTLERLSGAAGLRLLLSGGERQRYDDLRRLRGLLPALRLVNHYGPTEATIGCIAGEIPEALLTAAQPVQRLGRPIAGARIHILDERLHPLPAGVQGEIVVSGLGLADGYVSGDPAAASRFVTLADGRRAYRTGDQGWWLPDGAIAFNGRRDDQVKVRGYRVGLGEVEAALRGLPRIADACALVLEEGGEGVLAAAVVPAEGEAAPAAADLRAALLLRLPDHMLPQRFAVVEALPLTANGKVDRALLAAHPGFRQTRGAGAVESGPRTPLEETLCRLWQELLNVPAVGVDDDFFALGGHSIKAIQLLSRLRKDLGPELEMGVRDIFEYPTVRLLAARLEQGRAGPHDCLLPLREGRGGAPLFFLPAVLGTATVFRGVAALLPADRPCHALQCPGFDDDQPLLGLEDLARHFAARIAAAAPEGALSLVGWSFGGVLAVATARALERLGRTVRLALLDSSPHPLPPAEGGLEDPGTAAAYWQPVVGALTEGLPAVALRRLERLYRHNQDELGRHREPGGLRADILCLEAAGNAEPAGMADYAAVTRGRVTVQRLPCDHYGFLQPPMEAEVAARLAREL